MKEEERAARLWAVTGRVLGACCEVHSRVGPGLLESAYSECLARELTASTLRFERERPIALRYRGAVVENAYRADFIVEDLVLLEIKAVDALARVHFAQVYTYLELTGLDIGLLVNFHATSLRNGGIKRVMRRGAAILRSRDLPP